MGTDPRGVAATWWYLGAVACHRVLRPLPGSEAIMGIVTGGVAALNHRLMAVTLVWVG